MRKIKLIKQHDEKDCDQVFVLDKGQLVESGTHPQLRALKGTYEELWKMMAIA